MKGNSVSRGTSVLMLVLGVTALLLRKWLYSAAMDVKGLLVRSHPLEISVYVLTAAALVVIVLAVRKLETSSEYETYHRASLCSAVGHLAAGAGMLVTVLTGATMMGGYVEIVWRVLGLAAPVCMLAAGVFRALGKRPFFLLYVVVCLFLALHTVTRYQFWSGNPQMQDYFFSLLGLLALVFFGYYHAAWDAGGGNLRLTLGTGLAAIYFCTAELAVSSGPALYLGGLLWVLAELGSLKSGAAYEEK